MDTNREKSGLKDMGQTILLLTDTSFTLTVDKWVERWVSKDISKTPCSLVLCSSSALNAIM